MKSSKGPSYRLVIFSIFVTFVNISPKLFTNAKHYYPYPLQYYPHPSPPQESSNNSTSSSPTVVIIPVQQGGGQSEMSTPKPYYSPYHYSPSPKDSKSTEDDSSNSSQGSVFIILPSSGSQESKSDSNSKSGGKSKNSKKVINLQEYLQQQSEKEEEEENNEEEGDNALKIIIPGPSSTTTTTPPPPPPPPPHYPYHHPPHPHYPERPHHFYPGSYRTRYHKKPYDIYRKPKYVSFPRHKPSYYSELPRYVEKPKEDYELEPAAPEYRYSYAVHSPRSNDYKRVEEQHMGGVVKGFYSFLQPDGKIRKVSYTSDSKNGFNADVENIEVESIPGDNKRLKLPVLPVNFPPSHSRLHQESDEPEKLEEQDPPLDNEVHHIHKNFIPFSPHDINDYHFRPPYKHH